MRSDPSEVAMRNLRRLVEHDPILRDIVHPSLPTARRQARFQPAVDVIETEQGWTLILELPGVTRESLSVRLDGTRLSIRGEKPTREGRARVAERETGPFVREFIVPFQVRPEAIAARLADGLLTVSLPRTGPEEAQEIVVT
jgi:HSP20 family protein